MIFPISWKDSYHRCLIDKLSVDTCMDIHILFAKISWALLIGILLSRPLSDITGWKFFLAIVRKRKILGILCGISAVLHVVIYLSGTKMLGEYFSNPFFWRADNYFGWGSFALVAMLFPLLTSNKLSQRFFHKHWKSLQQFAYPAFIFTGIHISMIKGDWVGGFLPILIWAIVWLWAYLKK